MRGRKKRLLEKSTIGIPPGMKDVTITAIGRDGQTASYEVK